MSSTSQRLVRGALALGLLVAPLAACSKTDSGVTASDSTASGKGCAALDSAGVPAGSPVPQMPAEVKPVLEKTDLKVGEGEEAKAADTVTAHYTGVSCSTGKVFQSSWADGSAVTFDLARVIPGWQQGIPGMKVGGQRQLVIPPALAYGPTPPPGSGIKPNETLIFVVELESIGGDLSSTTTTAALESAAGKPCVAAVDPPSSPQQPTVSMPEGLPPAAASQSDLVVGTGATATDGATVQAQIVLVACSTGKTIDSTWAEGTPATLRLDDTLLQGLRRGIVGMKEGGRRQLILPPADLPPAGFPGIAPDETLVFVVDLVKVGG